MAVERVDYYSDQEYQQALQQEEQQQEPDVVPCFKCGSAMYENSNIPEENICGYCLLKA